MPSVQGEVTEAPQKRKRWLLSKVKQGFQQLQKLNLAFQDWTERFWKASALSSPLFLTNNAMLLKHTTFTALHAMSPCPHAGICQEREIYGSMSVCILMGPCNLSP